MAIVVVDPGICGMTVTIEVTKVGKQKGKIEITSECEKITKMSESLPDLSLLDALKPHVDSAVYKYASKHHLCTSCPVPMAILKTIEVEVGLALPRPVLVHFKTTEQE